MSVVQKRDLSDFRSELEALEKQGFIIEDNGVWRVRASVFLSFVAD